MNGQSVWNLQSTPKVSHISALTLSILNQTWITLLWRTPDNSTEINARRFNSSWPDVSERKVKGQDPHSAELNRLALAKIKFLCASILLYGFNFVRLRLEMTSAYFIGLKGGFSGVRKRHPLPGKVSFFPFNIEMKKLVPIK